MWMGKVSVEFCVNWKIIERYANHTQTRCYSALIDVYTLLVIVFVTIHTMSQHDLDNSRE